MAELQTNVASNIPFYRGRMPGIVRSVREAGRAIAPVPPDGEKERERREAKVSIAPEPTPADVQAPSKQTRRAYNREYMRQWRKRNQERYREYNREYQRKRHIERKINRILNAPVDDKTRCGYGCGRVAVETIERIDPRTWKTIRVPYCGHC